MPDNFEKPKNEKRPVGFFITWNQVLLVFLIIVVIWGLSYQRLSSPEFIATASAIPLQISVGNATVEIDSAQGWQPTGIRLEQGQVFAVEYLQGDWSIFPGDSIRYTADGGAAACGQPDCVEPIPDYTKSGLIGRIGDSAPFPVGSYIETTAQDEGMLQLRVNDAGTHDNEGSITVRVSTVR